MPRARSWSGRGVIYPLGQALLGALRNVGLFGRDRDRLQLMRTSLGRRLRDLLLILAVSDGEQSVFDKCDYRIGRIGLR